MSYSVILAKILPRNYMDDFLDGNLYLNNLSYFSSLDSSDQVRCDSHEGLTDCLQVKSISIQNAEGDWVPIGEIQNPVVFEGDYSENLNVLCLYSITDRQGDFFDERNVQFGEVTVLIKDLLEFISRIRTAAKVKGWEIGHSPIEYVSRNTYNGRMGPFRKFDEFSYQNEFRFSLKTDVKSPCVLSVGDLRDIVCVIETKQIPDFWSWTKHVKIHNQ